MKLLKPRTHGKLDYALALAFLLAPSLLGFQSEAARSLSHVVGATYMVVSLITRYPLGLLKLIPFPVHGVLETLAAVSWISLPFFADFADERAARNFFIGAGFALILVVMVTDYRGAAQRDGERRMGRRDRRLRTRQVAEDRRLSLFERRAGARQF